MSVFDSRTTPARHDLAAAHLKGKVEAARFVEGTLRCIQCGRAPLKARPESGCPLETELLFGELFTVYEVKDGWAWGQAQSDHYVGYLHTLALGDSAAPEHRVSALMTPLLPAPDVKHCAIDMLPLNARVRIIGRENCYAHIAPGGYVSLHHLAPLDQFAPDWIDVAVRFLGVPYVWGGKSHTGMDCSGLIQTALQASGISSPRDTNMMERALGTPCPRASPRARGDLVFWKGHMGAMLDAERLLHANAFHMEVVIEPLDEAIRRIAQSAGPVTSVRRI